MMMVYQQSFKGCNEHIALVLDVASLGMWKKLCICGLEFPGGDGVGVGT